jgi:hypothetical protein
MRKYADDEKRQVVTREHQRLHHSTVALEKVVCNGAQHEEVRCMTNIVQQLLENTKQHVRAHAEKTERVCQVRLMIDVTRHAKRCRVMCTKHQL